MTLTLPALFWPFYVMPEDVPDLTPDELDQIAEEVLGKPTFYRDTSKAVRAMQHRLQTLQSEKAALLDRMDESENSQLQDDLEDLNQRIDETSHRLNAYQQQHEGRN